MTKLEIKANRDKLNQIIESDPRGEKTHVILSCNSLGPWSVGEVAETKIYGGMYGGVIRSIKWTGHKWVLAGCPECTPLGARIGTGGWYKRGGMFRGSDRWVQCPMCNGKGEIEHD